MGLHTLLDECTVRAHSRNSWVEPDSNVHLVLYDHTFSNLSGMEREEEVRYSSRPDMMEMSKERKREGPGLPLVMACRPGMQGWIDRLKICGMHFEDLTELTEEFLPPRMEVRYSSRPDMMEMSKKRKREGPGLPLVMACRDAGVDG